MKRKLKPGHTPRHQFGAPLELWEAFKAIHGKRNASARLRTLIAQDIALHKKDPGTAIPGSITQQVHNASRG